MQSCNEYFECYFPILSGHKSAFLWQKRLFGMFCHGVIESSLSIPTGCGKTSVMQIWLLALAHAAETGGPLPPRRLVWVVNRRVVVDQATEEAEAIAGRLSDSGPGELAAVRSALRQLRSAPGELIGVSTLRGEYADNAEWRLDPARPAIVTGTVDMTGSRLLFSGYGCGYRSRPLHAGFLGQDTLIVHDEAHLEPAFQKLLEAIQKEQAAHDFRPLRVLQLTATSRSAGGGFALIPEERADRGVNARVSARKGIAFHAVAKPAGVADAAATHALALRDSGAAVLVFLRRLADVQSVCKKLEKEGCAVQRLTGTMRGQERDELMRDPILGRFLPGFTGGRREGTVYLISTSAGEVGVNLSADHAICDLTPFESMAQRLGRVNRFGKGDALVEVIVAPAEKATKFDECCERTLALLKELPVREDGLFDGSPAALEALDAARRAAAFSPKPEIPNASDILFDRWALTTVREAMPGRPPVADWLHGMDEEEPQTFVAWREEVEEIQDASDYDLSELLDEYPLKPNELLRENSRRVVDELAKIARRAPEASYWILDADGEVRREETLAPFADGDKKKLAAQIANRTLILPPAAGGLSRGFLAGDEKHNPQERYDVSDRWTDEKGRKRRVRLWDHEPPEDPSMRLVRTFKLSPNGEDGEDDASEPRDWRWYVKPRSADDDGSRFARFEQPLDTHRALAEKFAIKLAKALRLGEAEAEALRMAAHWHDQGKDRDLWQRSIGNRDYPEVKLAKSGENVPPKTQSRYRHEFGSLLDMDESAPDLARHMVAAHHGRARPHFPPGEDFDPKRAETAQRAAAMEAPARYIRLQRQYGRWGLAYLESLLRVVDAWASQEERSQEANV